MVSEILVMKRRDFQRGGIVTWRVGYHQGSPVCFFIDETFPNKYLFSLCSAVQIGPVTVLSINQYIVIVHQKLTQSLNQLSHFLYECRTSVATKKTIVWPAD